MRQKEMILRQAAQVSQKTLTEFILESACQAAQDTLLDQRLFLVEDTHYQTLLELLEQPADENFIFRPCALG